MSQSVESWRSVALSLEAFVLIMRDDRLGVAVAGSLSTYAALIYGGS